MTEAMAEEIKDNKLHIRLHVYDTEMSVNVLREDEKLYRDAAKLITDTVNSYASYFKGRKSDKDLLYMSLIDIALRYERESTRNDTEPYSDILGKLTSEIEEALK
jgi:cell division protein ZapA